MARDAGDVRGLCDTPGELGVAGDVTGGSVTKGASAVLMKPLMKRVPADAPGRHATGSCLPDEAPYAVRLVVHRAVIPHLLRPGLRVPRPGGQAHGVRDAGRGGPVAAVAARPGALVLRPGPLERR